MQQGDWACAESHLQDYSKAEGETAFLGHRSQRKRKSLIAFYMSRWDSSFLVKVEDRKINTHLCK